MAEDCKHGMNPDWCSICLKLPELDSEQTPLLPRVKFKAKFDGTCSVCASQYFVGEIVSAEIKDTKYGGRFKNLLCVECSPD